MKIDIVPESLLERILLAVGLIPVPIVHTMLPLLMSRTIITAVRFGVFEALASRPLTESEAASACGVDRKAAGKLLHALCGIGYVRRRGDRYGLTRTARRWLTTSGSLNVSDAVLHRHLDMRLMEHSDTYLRSGTPASFHDDLSDEDWKIYLDGQRAQARLTLTEIVRRIPWPKGAQHMLDLGGAHGLVADAMCRKHPELQAVVMDLPQITNLVDMEQLSSRIAYESGDIRVKDPGADRFDLVFIGNLIHHFDVDTNVDVIAKATRSLRAGGLCVVSDFFASSSGSSPPQITALLDFYFAVSSGGGAWSTEDVKNWMAQSELKYRRIVKLRSAPGMALVIAAKPA